MLVLVRHEREEIVIDYPDGTRVVLTVIEARHGKARLGFDAPLNVKINRRELVDGARRGDQSCQR